MSGSFQEQFAAAEPGVALQNVEAEIGLLGDIIDDNRLVDLIADRLRGRDFSVPLYGRVFDQILDQTAAGANVDAVTLSPHFQDDPEWPRAFKVLSAATLNAGPRARSKAYFEQITMLSARRRMVAGLQDVVHSARDLGVTREELLANADEAVAELAEQVVTAQAPVGTYANWMWLDQQLGACPEAGALAGPQGNFPGWGPNHKLSGLAADLWTLKFDEKGKIYPNGVPQRGRIVEGVYVYDPRQDSTYPGGSGACRLGQEATYVWSENPALHAITWAFGRYQNSVLIAGGGLAADGIDILMSDLSTKPAGDIAVGDLVRTRHEVGFAWGIYPVEAVLIVDSDDVWEATIGGKLLRATGDHLVWTGSWVKIRDVAGSEPVEGTHQVVKITVTGAHTYVSNDILSHNIKMIQPETANQN
jgi:hypothetical protein